MRLVIRDLDKNYKEMVVFNQAGYTFEQGRIYGLLGKSQSGKSTLLQCIAGECEYDGGYIEIIKESVGRKLRQEDVGIIYQLPTLPEFMSSYEFVKYYMDLYSNVQYTQDQYLDMVNIPMDIRNTLIKDLSQDMKMKLQYLYGIIGKFPIVLMDDVLQNETEEQVSELMHIIKNYMKQSVVILTTDNFSLMDDLCDEMVLIVKGNFRGITKEQLNDSKLLDEIKEYMPEEFRGGNI